MRSNYEVPDELGAVIERLKATPVSDPRQRAAILARVRGRRPAPWRAALSMAWQPSVPFLAAASLAVAALGTGYAARVLLEPASSGPAVLAVESPDATPVVPVVDDGRVARQFILSDSSAQSVTLVGDFNGWGETPAVLKDPTGTGVWEVTLLLPPGRYTYAFLVNDSLWTIDPRAPSSAVGDYGRTSSVALVTGR